MGSIKEALSIERKPHLREVSYSSYLYPSEDSFLRKLVEKSKIPNSTITIQIANASIGRKKVEDGEIDVFGAEKYFNGGIDEESIDHQHMKKQQLHLSPSKVETQARTPSLHSNSSRNSQSALLQSGQKNSTHNKNAKWRQGKSLLSTISCSCSCGDKNSVDIDEHKIEKISKRNFREEVYLDRMNKSVVNSHMEEMQMKKIEGFGMDPKKEDFFTFPILNPNPVNLETKLVFREEEDKRRMKQQMLDSHVLEKRNESISLERKLNLFTLGINARGEEIDFPPSSNGIFEGFESDSSSDLFEIKGFTITNNSNPYLLRQASNVSGCVTPGYAPSEASIEWSVVTASAADFCFASDSDNPSGKGKVEERRLGIFSGCKSQKTVTVAEEAYKTNGKAVSDTRGHQKPGPNQISRIDSRKR